jgi:hypothetical protein
LRIAVWTEETKILWTIVSTYSIDVIQYKVKFTTVPQKIARMELTGWNIAAIRDRG